MLMPSEQLAQLIKRNVLKRWPELKQNLPPIIISRPTEKRYGDYASALPMQLAARLKRPPLDIANEICAEGFPMACIKDASVAPPGFINFILDPAWLWRQPKRILAEGKNYGRVKSAHPEKIMVEFISANPTGPLTLGNGRGGFTGDVLTRVLKMAGQRVHTEYYVNDRGHQADILAESIVRRYFKIKGIPVEFPDYCYQGEYISELAQKLKLDNLSLNNIDKAKNKIRERAVRTMMSSIKQVINKKLKIGFDRYFLESDLYQSGIEQRVLRLLREKGLIEEKENAVWFKSSQFGDEKDRVLIKSNGEKTYFLSDIAYIWDKFVKRKFGRSIILLGADHHGYVRRLQAAAQALGQSGRLEVILFQLVKLMENGQEVRMSKRAGTFVTLEELVDEVGLDVARFFFLMVAGNTHMDFDLGLAKEQSEKNPVFYVQYAHARIASLLRKTRPLIRRKKALTNLTLDDRSALALIRELIVFPELVSECARTKNVHELTNYAQRVAASFHDFYTRVRIIQEDSVNRPALDLAEATQIVLQQTLGLLGIRAPDRM